MGFPGGSDCKEFASNAGDLVSIPGLRRSPGEGNGYSLQYSCLEKSVDGEVHGQMSLVSYSPWGRKDLDTTEHTHTELFTSHVIFIRVSL